MGDSIWYNFLDETMKERYELVAERIVEISKEPQVTESYKDFFSEAAAYLEKTMELCQMAIAGTLQQRSLETCKGDQEFLYHHMLPAYYAESYANPAYAVTVFGEKEGELLSFLRAELDVAIAYAFEGKLAELTLLIELFVQVYNCFEEEDVQEAKQTIYWYFHDYSEIFIEDSVRELVDSEEDFLYQIVMNSDLNDLRYLYQYGQHIGKNETGIAAFLNGMSDEEIQAMADTYTEGYRIGFAATGKDLSKKTTAQVRFPIGFERMVRAAVKNLEKLNLKVTMRACSSAANKQYDYDHKEDKALYYDKAYVERRLEVMKTSFEEMKKLANGQAGPAFIEVYGEIQFSQ